MLDRLIRFVLISVTAIFASLLVSSCWKHEAKKLPDEATYLSDTKLMYNICNKFVEETNIERLHSVARDVQTLRLMACDDYNGECSLYSEFLRDVIKLTSNGTLSASDRIRLRDQLAKLKVTIEMGKLKLHKEWSGLKK